ncbi:MAG: carbohydrate ABC transporter permease [Candidatus Cloacimonetes bacterium]|nr:carbohydrate ABC transporter permease [Candidatus Cloacimonadota bacterium]MBT6765990.1 carbohydrate ABC transporter permease [Prolixibacteraceae bacterium]MBT6993632.1 carbohydrate ABC transporter permease [Candidatus Cloacimonadota bacterium]MBT7470087.1 carbohydrate ABC transporter permease [Candidatus Cloacimonadota bacterium]
MMKKTITYTILSICGLLMIIPFIWMLTTSVKSQLEVNKGNVGFLPIENYKVYFDGENEYLVTVVKTVGDSAIVHLFDEKMVRIATYKKIASNQITEKKEFKLHFENFTNAFNKVPFKRYFFNTLFVSFSVVIGVLITGSLAAYAFATMRFKGRDFIFYLFISMMMVPQPVYLIPSYVLLNHLGWIDTYQALIIPWIANIFTIFLLRQQFKTIPSALFDAARIDGCGRFRTLWTLVLPLSKSVIVTSAIFGFIGSWNSFMWPLVMTDSPEIRVLQVGLSYFSQESSAQTSLLMAASTFSILPLVLLFLILQKQIIASFASSGLKG